MNKLFITTILALGVLLLSATALPVSAGVEPSPFRDKTIANRIRVAQNQLGPVATMLERIEERITDLNQKGMYISVCNLLDALPDQAINSLRTLESSKAMFQDVEFPEYGDMSEALEELRKYDEYLKDKVLGLEQNPNLPKAAKMALRQLAGILQDIQNEVDEFLSGNVD